MECQEDERPAGRYQPIFNVVKQHFNASHVSVGGRSFAVTCGTAGKRIWVPVGQWERIHYEWRVTEGRGHHEWKGVPRLDCALHFGFDDEALCEEWMQSIASQNGPLAASSDVEFYADGFGKDQSRRAVMFRIPVDSPDLELKAARLMGTLIRATWPLIQERLRRLPV